MKMERYNKNNKFKDFNKQNNKRSFDRKDNFRKPDRSNRRFEKKSEERKSSLNEKEKFILNICELPETAFFPITSYLMS